MNYIIAVFRSRNETLNFANLLKGNRFPCAIINTPKEVGLACGISVKFLEDYLGVVTNLVNSYRFMTFQGFFKLSYMNGRIIAVRV